MLCFFIASCNTHHIEEKSFLFEAELTVAHRFPIHESFSPFRMHMHNEYLILSNTFNPNNPVDYFYQAYKLSDFTFVGAFGPRGRGPGEWLNPDVVWTASTSPFFYLCEFSSRQSTAIIHKMAIDSLVKLIEVGSFSVEKGNCTMNRPVIKNDSLLVFDEFTPDIRALRVHHLLDDHPVITWEYGTTTPMDKLYLEENRGILRANDSSIVFIYLYKDMIDIMDWDLKLKKRINYQRRKPVLHENLPDNKIYHTATFLGENFLYAFYSDIPETERKARNRHSLALEVFDMNAIPVSRLTNPPQLPSP